MTKTKSKKAKKEEVVEEQPTFPDTPWGHAQRAKAEAKADAEEDQTSTE